MFDLSAIIKSVMTLFLSWPLWGQVVALATGISAIFGAVSQTRNLYRAVLIEPRERNRLEQLEAALRNDIREIREVIAVAGRANPIGTQGFFTAQAKPLEDISTRLGSLGEEYVNEYETRTSHYMLSHIFALSTRPDQKYDVYLFVVRHERGDPKAPYLKLPELKNVTFFLGPGWKNEEFPVEPVGDEFGVRAHAWGTFLAACRITFKDERQAPITLYRYVDFWMPPAPTFAELVSNRIPISPSA
jgi:hypothetical protein